MRKIHVRRPDHKSAVEVETPHITDLDHVLSENALSDADWFALNRDREFRLRPLFPGETFAVAPDFVMPTMGWGMWMVVKQIAPGVRVEHSICVDLEIAADAADLDLVVRAMFELLVINSTGTRRRTPVTSQEICTLVKQYMREKMN
jgi:hypothetical protein